MNCGPRIRLGMMVLPIGVLFLADASVAQQATLTARVEMSGVKPVKKSLSEAGDLSNVVIWLTPTDGNAITTAGERKRPTPTITQQNKSFTPHVLAVQVGTVVLFPNKDRFLHNIFSLHDGRQFDLGFYEAGSAKSVRFDRPGVSYLFCNIHPEMAAAVIAVDTPYFATSDASGKILIQGVAEGKYVLHVWSDRSLPEDLKKLETEVNISGSSGNLGIIHLTPNPNFTTAHKNKYGQDYVPPTTSDYGHP